MPDQQQKTSAHTPGPWDANFEDPQYPGEEPCEITHQGSCIARVYGSNDFPCLDPSEEIDRQMAANARLIAAAPELLAVVQDMIALTERNVASGRVSGRRTPEYEEQWQRAITAVAKATGKEAAHGA